MRLTACESGSRFYLTRHSASVRIGRPMPRTPAGTAVADRDYQRTYYWRMRRRILERRKARRTEQRLKRQDEQTAKPSSDEKKQFVGLRLPASLVSRIQRLTLEGIARGTHPWRTYTETYHALILRGLESLGSDPLVAELLPHLKLQEQIQSIRVQRKEVEASLRLADEEISALLEIKADKEAAQYFHAARSAAADLPATIWRDWLIARLDKRFPHLAREPALGVSLAARPDPVAPSRPS